MGLVETGKVAMLQKKGGEVAAYTVEGRMVTNYEDLDELEVQLDPRTFLRLGADMLVNVRMISEIVPWAGGSYVMTLGDSDSTEVRLSRTQAQLLKNKAGGK
jgi:DNA-binding LytR/AlgR family response regulator